MPTKYRVTDRRLPRAILLATAAGVALAGASVAFAADIPVYVAPAPAPAPMPVAAAMVPSFYIDVSALYMTRRSPAPGDIIIDEDLNEGDVILNANDFDFNWRPGIQVRAGTSFGGNLGIDFGGFWLAPMTATVATSGTGDIAIQTNPNTDLVGIGDIDALNTTTFRGADVNLTYAMGDGFSLFGGLAYIGLHDNMMISAAGIGTTYDYEWDVNNRMIGPQIGANVNLMGGPGPGLFVDATMRAGLLFNSITSTVQSDLGNGDNLERARTLMVGGGITAGYNINENFAVTLGYQGTFLKNVALAPDQVGVTGNLNQVDIPLETTTGNFLAHGLTLGLNLRF